MNPLSIHGPDMPTRIENLYTISGELLMCKLEYYKEELNWAAFNPCKFLCWHEFVDNADENEIVRHLAEEAAEEAAAYFDYEHIVPLDALQKNLALHMVFYRSSEDYMAFYDLEPME